MKTFSIDEWCALHGFSRAFFYLLAKRGEGPRSFKIGRCHRISQTANDEWIAEREAAGKKVAA
jgi:predicted DNA-binding transcriptional regulator AlpA